MEPYLNNNTPAQSAPEPVREAFESDFATRRAQRGEKEAILRETQMFVEEHEPNLKKAYEPEIQLAEKAFLLESLREEVDDLTDEINNLRARATQWEAAIDDSETDAGMAAPTLQSFDGEAAFLNTQLWVKEVALQLKKSELTEKEEVLRASRIAAEIPLTHNDLLLERRDAESQLPALEMNGLTSRDAQIETATTPTQIKADAYAGRVQESFKAEIAALNGRLKQTEDERQAKPAAVEELERSLKATIEDMQAQLAEKGTRLQTRDGEIQHLESEIDGLLERIAQLESALARTRAEATGEAERIRENSRAEVGSLRAQLNKQEEALALTRGTIAELEEIRAAKESAVRELEQGFHSTLAEMQNELAAKVAALNDRDQEIVDLRSELRSLEEQSVQIRSAIQEAQEAATGEREKIWEEFKAETAALQSRLTERDATLGESQIALRDLDKALSAKISDLETQLTEKQAVLENRDNEIVNHKAEMARLVERSDQMWGLAQQAQAEAAIQVKRVREGLEAEVVSLQAQLRETEESRQAQETTFREAEERSKVSLQDLQVQLTEKQALLENRNDEIERLTSEIARLAQRSAQPETAIKLVELEAGSEVDLIGENDRGDGEMLHAAVCEDEKPLEKKPADIVELENDHEIKIYGAEPLPTPDQPCAQGRNGNGRDLKGELPEWMGPGAPDGQSLPFSLFNLPSGVQRATDMFPLKFMQQYKFFPMKLQNGSLAVAMSDPSDVYTLDAIHLQAGAEISVYSGDEQEIVKAINEHYGPSSSMERIIQDIGDEDELLHEDGDVAHLKDLASEAPVIRLVNLLITKAVDDRASDIHIEPFDGSLRVRYRIDGLLVDTESPPQRLQLAIISRVKLMAKMNIAERRLPQDGRIKMEVSGRELDLRVSTIPTLHGESVVIRLLDRSSVLLAPDELGFPPDVRQRFDGLIRRPNGIILVTGPTGSGKTTTLYAALRAINSVEKNIITIEDPVEYQMKGVKQIQVRPNIGLNFATGLRHIVRQDPDVILVGEIRDHETADIAIHAALTGHLVLSTLHTNDAAGAVTRLLDMGIQNYLVSSTLLAVLAQRLVRRICPHCRQPYTPDKESLEGLGLPAADKEKLVLYRGSGCAACGFSGYFSRLGIFELLVVDDALQRLILEKTDSATIRKKSVERGMKTMWQDGWEKALAGLSTLDEILRVSWEE